jgi:hypothetical protein
VGSVNFGYLEGFLSGDKAVVLEILDLFRQQGATWTETLTVDNPDWRAVVHAIKGASRGVGADVLGDACHQAEFGAPEDLPKVREELDIALAEITAYIDKGGVA